MEFPDRRALARKKSRGSAITDFGPAIFILFVLVLFPLIDFLYLSTAYGICWYLNHMETKELSVNLPQAQAQVLTDVDNQFVTLGLAKFVGLTATEITHPAPGPVFSLTSNPPTLRLVTRTTVQPFLNIPFPVPVPGLNAPITFDVSSVRVQEELGKD